MNDFVVIGKDGREISWTRATPPSEEERRLFGLSIKPKAQPKPSPLASKPQTKQPSPKKPVAVPDKFMDVIRGRSGVITADLPPATPPVGPTTKLERETFQKATGKSPTQAKMRTPGTLESAMADWDRANIGRETRGFDVPEKLRAARERYRLNMAQRLIPNESSFETFERTFKEDPQGAFQAQRKATERLQLASQQGQDPVGELAQLGSRIGGTVRETAMDVAPLMIPGVPAYTEEERQEVRDIAKGQKGLEDVAGQALLTAPIGGTVPRLAAQVGLGMASDSSKPFAAGALDAQETAWGGLGGIALFNAGSRLLGPKLGPLFASLPVSAKVGGNIVGQLGAAFLGAAGGQKASEAMQKANPAYGEWKGWLREEMAKNPELANVGQVIGSLAPWKAAPQKLALLGQSLKQASKSGSVVDYFASRDTELSNLIDVGLGGLIETGVEGVRQIGEGQFDPMSLALATVSGLLYSEPGKLASKMGVTPTDISAIQKSLDQDFISGGPRPFRMEGEERPEPLPIQPVQSDIAQLGTKTALQPMGQFTPREADAYDPGETPNLRGGLREEPTKIFKEPEEVEQVAPWDRTPDMTVARQQLGERIASKKSKLKAHNSVQGIGQRAVLAHIEQALQGMGDDGLIQIDSIVKFSRGGREYAATTEGVASTLGLVDAGNGRWRVVEWDMVGNNLVVVGDQKPSHIQERLGQSPDTGQVEPEQVRPAESPEQSPSPVVRASHDGEQKSQSKKDKNGLDKAQKEYILENLAPIARGESEPSSIQVPDDGTFTVSTQQQASTLYRAISGKPLDGAPEPIASKRRSAGSSSSKSYDIDESLWGGDWMRAFRGNIRAIEAREAQGGKPMTAEDRWALMDLLVRNDPDMADAWESRDSERMDRIFEEYRSGERTAPTTETPVAEPVASPEPRLEPTPAQDTPIATEGVQDKGADDDAASDAMAEFVDTYRGKGSSRSSQKAHDDARERWEAAGRPVEPWRLTHQQAKIWGEMTSSLGQSGRKQSKIHGAFHEAQVKLALSEGRRVPDRVVDDFVSRAGNMPDSGIAWIRENISLLHPDIAKKYGVQEEVAGAKGDDFELILGSLWTEPEITSTTRIKGTDGNWYSSTRVPPKGVEFTDEMQTAYAILGQDGVTVHPYRGKGYKDKAELEAAIASDRAEADAKARAVYASSDVANRDYHLAEGFRRKYLSGAAGEPPTFTGTDWRLGDLVKIPGDKNVYVVVGRESDDLLVLKKQGKMSGPDTLLEITDTSYRTGDNIYTTTKGQRTGAKGEPEASAEGDAGSTPAASTTRVESSNDDPVAVKNFEKRRLSDRVFRKETTTGLAKAPPDWVVGLMESEYTGTRGIDVVYSPGRANATSTAGGESKDIWGNRHKLLTLKSRNFDKQTPRNIAIVLHEIAHLNVGSKHGPEWQAEAIRLYEKYGVLDEIYDGTYKFEKDAIDQYRASKAELKPTIEPPVEIASGVPLNRLGAKPIERGPTSDGGSVQIDDPKYGNRDWNVVHDLAQPVSVIDVNGNTISVGAFERVGGALGKEFSQHTQNAKHNFMMKKGEWESRIATIKQLIERASGIDRIPSFLWRKKKDVLRKAESDFIELVERPFDDPERMKVAASDTELGQALRMHDELTEQWRQYIIETRRSLGIEMADDWGITDKGYFRHAFLDRVKVIVDGEIVYAANYADAQRIVIQALEKNPNAGVMIRARIPNFGKDEAVELSRKGFWRLVGRLSQSVQIDKADILDDIKGVVRPKHTPIKFYGPLLERKGAKGYSLEYGKIMDMTAVQLARSMELSKWARNVQPIIDRFRKNEGTPEQLDPYHKPLLANAMDAYKHALWGSPTESEKKFGQLVRRVFPNAESPEFALREIADKIASLQSFLSLRYNIRSSAANLFQVSRTLFPFTSAKEIARLIGKITTDKDFREIIKHSGVVRDMSKLNESSLRTWTKEMKSPFGAASDFNRALGFAFGYEQAIKNGMDADSAIRNGLTWAEKVEFDNTVWNVQPVMRAPMARILLQFKSFAMKDFENFLSVIGKMPGDEKIPLAKARRVTKWLAGLGLGAGVRVGDVVAKLFGIQLAVSVYQAAKEAFIENGMDEETADKTAAGIYLGVPAGLGADMSSSLGLPWLEEWYGRTPWEKLGGFAGGPTLGKAVKVYSDIQSGNLDKIPKRVTPYAKAWEAVDSWVSGNPIQIKVGNEEYIDPPLSMAESVMYALGFTPTRQTLFYELKDAGVGKRDLPSELETAMRKAGYADPNRSMSSVPESVPKEKRTEYKNRVWEGFLKAAKTSMTEDEFRDLRADVGKRVRQEMGLDKDDEKKKPSSRFGNVESRFGNVESRFGNVESRFN